MATRHCRHGWQAFNGDGSREDMADLVRFLHLEALRVECETAIRLRDGSRNNDDVARRLERELGLAKSRLILS